MGYSLNATVLVPGRTAPFIEPFIEPSAPLTSAAHECRPIKEAVADSVPTGPYRSTKIFMAWSPCSSM
jgi:hypothetical protein